LCFCTRLFRKEKNKEFMRYYSTNKNTGEVTLKEAVIKGLASDKGLFMPEKIRKFDKTFFDNINKLSFRDISLRVAQNFFDEDIQYANLHEIVFDTLKFDCPVVKVTDKIYSLELFHGPTLAFKDIGARFMARLLKYFLQDNEKQVNILVATSGDTGSAVANGFLGVEGIHVFVLYPRDKVSRIQESQFTTLGQNVTAIEIEGTFDDCQRLVKSAFLDDELNSKMLLTSANSINVARFLPQAFYYFNAYARLRETGALDGNDLIISVPSGNFGNLTAGLFAREMGLPVKYYLAANNANDVVYEYLKTGNYIPRISVETLANAMDVGDPSNFVRILDLYNHSYTTISNIIKGFRYYDDQIRSTIEKVYERYGYLCDPHGACGYQALEDFISGDQVGIFLETAHPAKFKESVESILGKDMIEMPERLKLFLQGEKQSIPMKSDFYRFKKFLLAYK
jgi:threonine synthase